MHRTEYTYSGRVNSLYSICDRFVQLTSLIYDLQIKKVHQHELMHPKNPKAVALFQISDTLIFFSDLEFFGYTLYKTERICNTKWYRITRLGNSRVAEQTKTSKIRRKIAENQFPLLFGYFSITEHSHWRIIWMRLKISAFGYFMFVVLERRQALLRPSHIKFLKNTWFLGQRILRLSKIVIIKSKTQAILTDWRVFWCR